MKCFLPRFKEGKIPQLILYWHQTILVENDYKPKKVNLFLLGNKIIMEFFEEVILLKTSIIA